MTKQQEQFQKSVMHVLEAVMFENWLRFYFITEIPGAPPTADGRTPLFVAVPDKGMDRIKEDYTHLLSIAEDMNGKEIDFETSRRTVCTFVLEHLDGKVMSRNMAAVILGSAIFQAQMQLFNIWVQMYESRLDETFLEFGEWRNLFAQWRQSPGAREIAGKLLMSGQSAVGSAAETTQ